MTNLANKAEGGTNGTTVVTGNSGGSSGNAWNSVQNTSPATLTFDNAHSAHGGLSYKITTGSPTSTVYLIWTSSLTGSTLTQVWFRTYMYITANPSGTNLQCIAVRNGSTVRGRVGINTSGKVILIDSTAAVVKTSTASVPLNQWFRLEGFIIGDASVGQLECKIFTTSADEATPDETITTTAAQNTGGTINRIDYGNLQTTASYTQWMDDLGASTTGYMGPSVVAGTADITLKKMTAIGSGNVKVAGTGEVSLKKMTTDSSGLSFVPGKRVTWDNVTDKTYSTGISQAVLYPKSSPGVAWNGLISVTEKGDDNTTSISLDGQLATAENLPGTFAGSLSAYMYPEELEASLGNVSGFTSQPRQTFGLCYKDNHQLHILYNVLLKPGSDKYQTLSDNSSALAFAWDFTTTPVEIPWGRPSAHLVIMVDYAQPDALSALEDVIYGNAANAPSLPDPLSIYNIFDPFALMTVTDNGDGTWTADDNGHGAISMIDSDNFQITWPSAVFLSDTTYRIHSL